MSENEKKYTTIDQRAFALGMGKWGWGQQRAGMQVISMYRQVFGRDPEKIKREVRGQMMEVFAYPIEMSDTIDSVLKRLQDEFPESKKKPRPVKPQRPQRPGGGYRQGGGRGGYQNSGRPQGGGYRPNYQSRDRDGGQQSGERRSYGNREGGYQQSGERRSYGNREGGYQQRSYGQGSGERREGGYQQRRPYNQDRERRPYNNNGGERREGGYQRNFNNDRREGGYDNRREGGYENRRNFPPRERSNEGGYQRREGGYQSRRNDLPPRERRTDLPPRRPIGGSSEEKSSED
ncbi:hypothetical protein [Persicobacter diffluens]|uniref:Uncharacterized protein n=1 Tax=Persicobacter diffluens TaxID=981 RepID=A0AAN4VZP9_9BACT|nr:hypothetical protein PEDI_23370 [Persicobacter diffluens]